MVFAQRWFTVAVGLSWVPWGLLGLFLIQEEHAEKRWAGAGLLALAVGLGFNGGYPGITVYLVGLLLLLHGAWLLGAPGWSRAWGVWRWALLAGLACALISAGPVLSTRRLAQQSIRGASLSLDEAAKTSMTPASLGQVFLPQALGRSRDNSFLGKSWRFGTHLPQGMLLYIGVLGALLAAFAFVRLGKSLWSWGLAIALLVLYALGDHTPLYAYFIKLPLLDHLRGPAKAAELVGFMLAVPLALAVDRLDAKALRSLGWVAGALGAGLILAGAALALWHEPLLEMGRRHIEAKVLGDGLHHYPAQYYLDKAVRWLVALRGHLLQQGAWALAAALGLALVLRRRWPAGLVLGLLLFGELASNGMHYTPRVHRSYYERVPDSVAMVLAKEQGRAQPFRALVWGWSEHFRASFPQGRREGDMGSEQAFLEFPQRDLPLAYGLDLYNAYYPTGLKRQEALHGWFQDVYAEADMEAQTEELLRKRRLFDLGGAKYAFSSRLLDAPGLKLLQAGRPMVYENLHALPLAYLADTVSGGWDAARAEAALCAPKSPYAWPKKPALVEAPGSFGNAPGSVRWLTYDDALWDLETESSGPATLALSRTCYQGLFEASVDGVKADLLPANVGYWALRLPAGKHRVRVALADPLDAWAPWAYAVGLLLGLGLLLAGLFRRQGGR